MSNSYTTEKCTGVMRNRVLSRGNWGRIQESVLEQEWLVTHCKDHRVQYVESVYRPIPDVDDADTMCLLNGEPYLGLRSAKP